MSTQPKRFISTTDSLLMKRGIINKEMKHSEPHSALYECGNVKA